MEVKPCLFDMDGTIANHTDALMRDLAKIQSPNDPLIKRHDPDEPDWVKERKRLIRSQRDWWLNLEKMQLGFDVYDLARQLGFQINILTKGPWTCDHAWTEKVQWVRKHLDHDVKITITEDKSLVYGRVLVDDYLPYVQGWLKYRPRGVVIMPANGENIDWQKEDLHGAIEDGRIVRYDGSNMAEVETAMIWAYKRK